MTSVSSPINHGVVYGDELSFEARHILDIDKIEERAVANNSPLQPIGRVVNLQSGAKIVETSPEQFERIDPASIPDGLRIQFPIRGIIGVSVYREDDDLVASVGRVFDPQVAHRRLLLALMRMQLSQP